MNKFRFTAAHFNFDVTIEGHEGCDPEPRHLADRANALLDAELARCERVYSHQDRVKWATNKDLIGRCEYTALLWDMSPIKRKK